MLLCAPFVLYYMTQISTISHMLNLITAFLTDLLWQSPLTSLFLPLLVWSAAQILMHPKPLHSVASALQQRTISSVHPIVTKVLFFSTVLASVAEAAVQTPKLPSSTSRSLLSPRTPRTPPTIPSLSPIIPLLSSYVYNHQRLAGNPSACGKETTPAQAFTCLFKNLTFAIPNIHVPDIKGKITLDIDQLTCSHLAISLLKIDTTAPKSTEHDITAIIEGGTLSCAANIKISHIPILPDMSASVTFDVSKLQFSARIETTNQNDQHSALPTNAQLVVPRSNPTPDLSLSLHLSGNIIVKIINFLGKGILESVIKKEILKAISTTLPTAVTPLLNGLIRNVSLLMGPYLNPPDATPLPGDTLPNEADLIRWDSGLAGNVMHPLSTVLADVSEDQVPLLVHFVEFIGFFLGWQPGSIALKLDETIHIGNDGLSSSTNITISTFKINGFNTLDPSTLFVLDPTKALKEQTNGKGLQLSTTMTFPSLSFDLDGVVSVAPGSIIGTGEGTLSAPASIHVDLSNVSMELDLLVALDYATFEKLELGQMLNVNCLLPSLVALNVTKIDLQSILTPHSPPTVTFMSPGIDELFNELIGVVDGLYSQVLSEFIRGVVAVPVRNAINDITTTLLLHRNTTNRACGKMPTPSNVLPNKTKKDRALASPLLVNQVTRMEKTCNGIGTNQFKCDETKGCTFCSNGNQGECYTTATVAKLPLGRYQCNRKAIAAYRAMASVGEAFFDASGTNTMLKEDVPLDFASNAIFTLLFGLIDVVFNIHDKPLKYTMNDAISTLTNHTGEYTLNDLFDYRFNFGNIHANISIPYLKLHGLTSFTVLDLEASDSEVLSFDLQTNAAPPCDANDEPVLPNTLSIDVGVDLYLKVTDPTDPTKIATDVHEMLELSLLLPATHIGSNSIETIIDATSLAALTVEHLMSSPACIAEAIHNVSFGHLLLALPNITIELKCPDAEKTFNTTTNSSDTCTSQFLALSTLLTHNNVKPSHQLTSLLEILLHDSVNATLGQPVVHLMNDLLHNFLDAHTPGTCKQQQQLQQHYQQSQFTTPSSSGNGNNNSSGTPAVASYTGIYPVVSFWLGVCSVASFIVAIVLGGIMHCQVKYCPSTKIKRTCNAPCGDSKKKDAGSLHTPLLNPTDNATTTVTDANTSTPHERQEEDNDDCSDYSLMFHPNVPAYARLSIPLFLLSGALMYLSGNLNVGASVLVKVNAGGLYVPLPSLFDFSLGNSIRDMWNAQVYPLALLILLFSGVWPYVKLCMMFACWVIPPSARCCCSCRGGRGYRILKVQRRGIWLQLLDALGKWSLIDTFVLVMMMVAFRFHIQNQLTWNWIEFLPDNFIVVDVVVQPNWGIFAFIIATVISLISTHVVIAFHRAAAGSSLDAEDQNSRAVRKSR